ncbi:MAG: hypothetical protein AcusKO_16560 [Acuticoccus sp.]
MKVTIATVTLNAAADLPLTLESILGQDYGDLELLVVDGSSWDETPEVLSLYQRDIDRLEIIEDGGIFDAMNRAAQFASGEMILFLNAGDLFHSRSAVSRIMERTRPTADIVYGNHIYRDKGVEIFRPSWDFRMANEALKRGAVSAQWLERFPAHQATFTRTGLLRELAYDTAFRVCADHDFFLRAVAEGREVQFVDELVSIYVGGGFSLQRHELLKLEWNALHRRFSEAPEAVDNWYYGGRSPFAGTRSPSAGEAIAGLHAEEPAAPARGIHHPFRWLAADGARFLSPSDRRTTGMFVRGTNPFARQTLDVLAAGKPVAQTVIAPGPFAIDVLFNDTLPPGVVVDLVPEFGEAIGIGPFHASLAVREFTFKGEATTTPREVGATLRFNKAAGENAELMGVGWYNFEPSFTWSRGQHSDVRIATTETVTSLIFDMGPNPAVPGQTLTISVNGTMVREGPVVPDTKVDVGHLWRIGQDNVVTLRPSASATVGDDPRDLGFALVSIKLV